MFIYSIGDVVGLFVIAILVLVSLSTAIKGAVRESKCKHQRYYETSACDAICADCGKNLGFIGDVRDRKA